jgi:hypothetical protein
MNRGKKIILATLLGVSALSILAREVVPYNSENIIADRQTFLKELGPNDAILVRWKSINLGKVTPLSWRGKFQFEMYPVLTWNRWIMGFFPPKIKAQFIEGQAISPKPLGQFLIFAEEIQDRVETSYGVTSPGSALIEQAGFKIAIDLQDQLSFGLAVMVKTFNPVYFDIRELLKSPQLTKVFYLTREDAKAEIEVRLVRGR